MGKRSVASPNVVAATSPIIDLSQQQRIFTNSIMQGMGPEVAARAAGYTRPRADGNRLIKSHKIVAALKYLNGKYERKANMTRKKVMDGFLEAIDMAKMQGEPSTMVQGWREIGRLCGYYAPEVKKVDISITAKRAIDKMETLSDAELVKLIEHESILIEGEAERVIDELDGDS